MIWILIVAGMTALAVFFTWQLTRTHRPARTSSYLKQLEDPHIAPDVLPPGRTPAAPEPRAARGKKCNIRLRYQNTRDQIFDRDIYIYSKGANIYLFEAWCSVDQVRRAFWFNRITQAIDLETGELMSAAGLYHRIFPSRRIPDHLLDGNAPI